MTKDDILQILNKPELQQGLNKYIWIQDHLHTCNVSTNAEFQKHFNGFYRLRQRKPDFYKTYYDFMETNKNKDVSFEETLHYLYQSLGRMEASFASKLVATVNTTKPVWDSIVLKNIGLKVPYASCSNREQKLIDLYYLLEKWYKQYLQTDEAKLMIECFDLHFPGTKLSSLKKVDLIL